ncbi:MAG: ATP-dependent helicase [Actinomycetota bacterium]
MTAALTAAQRRVVEHDDGRLLVLGPPGSGKTLALEHRYLRLAAAPGLAPHRILFLCNNRRYALGAKQRLAWELPGPALVEIPVFTWHALAYHLVARYYPRLDYREPPVLLTGPEQWGLVRELLAAEHPAGWPVWGDRLRDRSFIDEVADFCLRVQQSLIGDEELAALSRHRQGWSEVIEFHHRYRTRLREQSRVDHAGLISEATRLLAEHPDIRTALHRRFPHALVDEGEEMSRAHRRLLTLLQTDHLVLAADPDSGIEGFRGAQPDWVFGFAGEIGAHATIELEDSRRVGSPLAEAAGELIAHNNPNRPATFRPAAHETSYDCRLYPSGAAEVEAIARELRALHLREGVAWGEMAVLVSQPAVLLEPLQRALERWEVPWQSVSGDRPLAGEPAVACFLDLVKVALLEPGWEGLVSSLLTCPLVGLDFATRRSLERQAWKEGRTLAEVVEESADTEEFRMLRDLVAEHAASAEECFWEVYRASSYYRGLVEAALADPAHPAHRDLDALVAFSHGLGRFVERRHGQAAILDYLHEAARAEFGSDPWLPAEAAEADAVQLLSFHAAKGREWDTIVVAGCLDAWIPKGRRAQGLFDPFALGIQEVAEREVEAIADDRRTFFVAATRARRHAIFTVSPGASGRGRPSRFLMELAGEPPTEAAASEHPPLTVRELATRLRAVLASEASSAQERAAALIALAEVPGIDPAGWYGRWDWTEGGAPLAVAGDFRTSYSRLGVYDNCGLQYVLQVVLGLDPVGTYAMKFGTWLHALFQAVHENRIPDPPTLLAEYRALFDDTVFPNATVARQYRRDGEKMLETFWVHERKPATVKAEHKFNNLQVAGAVIRGRIDRIDKLGQNLVLVDYKTARWSAGYEEAAESLQLAIYHLAAREDPELRELGRPSAAHLVYPGSTSSGGAPAHRTQSPEQAEKVLAELPVLIHNVLSERFAPSPEAECRWCAMKPLCPLWPQGRELSS